RQPAVLLGRPLRQRANYAPLPAASRPEGRPALRQGALVCRNVLPALLIQARALGSCPEWSRLCGRSDLRTGRGRIGAADIRLIISPGRAAGSPAVLATKRTCARSKLLPGNTVR